MNHWRGVLAVCAALPLAACGPSKETLMAKCRATMSHGDLRWRTPILRFQGCMQSQEYHLVHNEKCAELYNPDDLLGAKSYAVTEPACWFWGSTNWP